MAMHARAEEREGALAQWLEPFLAALSRQAQRQWAPVYLRGLLGALGNAGIDLGSIGRMLGLSSTDPQQMQPNDIAQLMGYAQRNAPGALRQTTQDQPFFLKALGNPMVQGALAIMATRFLTKRNR